MQACRSQVQPATARRRALRSSACQRGASRRSTPLVPGQGDVDALGREVAEQRALRRRRRLSCGASVSSQALPAALCSAQNSAPTSSSASSERRQHAAEQRGAAAQPHAAARRRRRGDAARGRRRPGSERVSSAIESSEGDADAEVQRARCCTSCAVGEVDAQRPDGAAVVQADAVAERPGAARSSGRRRCRHRRTRAPSSAGRRSVSGCSSSTLPVSRTRPPTTAPLTRRPERAVAVAAHRVVAAGAKQDRVGHGDAVRARTPRRPRRARSRTSAPNGRYQLKRV